MNEKILIIGSGAREHALAWKLSQSPRVGAVFVAPGNGGTATGPGIIQNVPIEAGNFDELLAFATSRDISMTVVGPEGPLASGIVDRFATAGLRCFGPGRAQARLESSKAHAKDMMRRLGIPTADYATFTDYAAATTHLHRVGPNVVLKASGLAAGKGVILPSSMTEAEAALRAIMVERSFGDAGDEVIIEERLTGEEASVLAFCDGTTVAPMPPAQDHKPIFDGDRGPNTGGMGAFAPASIVDAALLDEIVNGVLQPVVTALASRGTPYIGVLYAGLMLTADGPRVLEFNCRLGDPETEVILPLLDNDLLDVLDACVDGTLDTVDLRWRDGVAATVVVASEGYPGPYPKGRLIEGAAAAMGGVIVFHAGTRVDGDDLVTDGGRVLAVTGIERDLPAALASAYRAIEHISFEGMHFRTDIGNRRRPPPLSYAASGVDIDAGATAVRLMADAVKSTHGPEVIGEIGGFGGMFDASGLPESPILVASTDGVGTKTILAAALGRFDTIGHDIVNHCINDILVQGAEPLFFLDYVATGKLDPTVTATIVAGMAAACRSAGCALLGGETAEMPGVYVAGEFDLAGTIVGVVGRDAIIDGARIEIGDRVIGIASSGLHTNGYSLARRVFAHREMSEPIAAPDGSLGSALLAPHRSYLADVTALRAAGVDIKGLVHVTGGGLVDNPRRILPEAAAMRINRSAWEVPPLFALIQAEGRISEDEMRRAFNLGLGMLVVVPPAELKTAQRAIGNDSYIVGEIVPRSGDPVEFV